MVFVRNPQKRKWLSNLVLLSFVVVVAATAFLSNAFKTPLKGNNGFIGQSLVFNNNELDNITNLSLKNKSGEFIFTRADAQPTSAWHMSSPRDLSAKSVFIEKLFASLNVIKTKKLLADDVANNSNFSLDKPTAILTLTDSSSHNIILSVGIMNTIDNSTYMKISGRSGIFHVEAPSISLENTVLADLIESSVFDLQFKNIKGFKIFKKGSKVAQFDMHKKDNGWVNAEEKFMDPKKAEETFDEFIKIKSSFILDELTDAQKKQTQSLISSADYTVKIEKEDNETLIYQISPVTNALPGVALNNEAHFIITEAHSPVVFVIKSEFLPRFELKNY
jgi:hypothetical protein